MAPNFSHLDILIGQSSLTGIRAGNEDYYGCVNPQKASSRRFKGIAAAIADGVGDTGEGAEASRTAVTRFLPEYFSTPDSWTIQRSGEEVLQTINKWLYAQGERRSGSAGLITTFSAVILCGRTLHVFHVGDSRVYLLAAGALKKLTRDHRAPHSGRQLVRALGLDTSLTVDYRQEILEPGMKVVMITDGVHNYLPEIKLLEILKKNNSLQHAAESLTRSALEAGSKDNITCQILGVKSLPPATGGEIRTAAEARAFPPVFRPEDVCDGFVIEEEIGAGAMGIVYRARDKATGKKIALKCPREELQSDPVVRERLLREEWIGSRTESPHLLAIHPPPAQRSRYYYLVMDLCPGRTLRQLLDEGKNFGPARVSEIGRQICRGLHKLHLLDIAHRDLKPDSIMMSEEGACVIIDYGISRVGTLRSLTVLPKDGFLGSPNYLAPEIFRQSPGSARTDIYSLGVTLYELLTKSFPYGDMGDTVNFSGREYRPLRELNPGIPAWLATVIGRCLEKDPEKRYQAVSEILFDLENPEKVLPEARFVPLMERNPVRFWKSLSLFWMLWAALFFYLWMTS